MASVESCHGADSWLFFQSEPEGEEQREPGEHPAAEHWLPGAQQQHTGNPLGLHSLQGERELVVWDSRQSSCWMQERVPEGAAAAGQHVPVGVV